MASDNIDNATHTYHSFVGLMKWGTAAALALGALVVLLISS